MALPLGGRYWGFKSLHTDPITPMNLSYKYRIYPTESQAKALQSQLDFCRFLYNSALEQKKLAFKNGRAKEASFGLQCKQISGIKNSEEFPEASRIRFSNLQAILRRLDRSFQNFFEERVFDCEACGIKIDRDLNASRNILRLGLSLVGEPMGSPYIEVEKMFAPSKLQRKAEEHYAHFTYS